MEGSQEAKLGRSLVSTSLSKPGTCRLQLDALAGRDETFMSVRIFLVELSKCGLAQCT